jgi:lipopolysaccharide/colanic/teichoic acid biosynthesis glycosyltransferase
LNRFFVLDGVAFAVDARLIGASSHSALADEGYVSAVTVVSTLDRDLPLGQQDRRRSILIRKRFQFASALVVAVLLPWWARTLIGGRLFEPSATNALAANTIAVCIAFWMRLSVETYPGIRRSYVILPAASSAHALVLLWFLLTRLPYDRLALVTGFLLHVLWLYMLYLIAERRTVPRIAVVPFGAVEQLARITGVSWRRLKRPRVGDARGCDAIVADFSADLPDEWEAFLADAAIAGRVVYQHKQLAESLTGRVELENLSENSFGSLLPARGYFHLKSVIDFLAALFVLPLLLPLMLLIAIAIRLDTSGPALFSQLRVGHAGRRIRVYKFRTMMGVEEISSRREAITCEDDHRVTRVGRILRKLRLDEVPQVINILRGEMSWIGPRPEAEVLSDWYTGELPFYRYRHVVKPGISGWAQVNQGHVAGVEEVHRKLQYDFYYIKYFSPLLDVLIVFRTVKTMLTGFGSR